jgi:adenylate cyclase
MNVDWEAQGLLDGLDAEARRARVKLLDRLRDQGFGLQELQEAVASDRLALLPVERALTGELLYTAAEAAALAGVEEPFLLQLAGAFGLTAPAPGEVIFGEGDVQAARAIGAFRQAGLSEQGLLEITRILADAMAPVAERIRRLVGETFLHPGDSEYELGIRYEHAARELTPLVGFLPAYALGLQTRELVRRDVLGVAERASGQLPETTVRTAVAFADLVGFTRVGERVSSEELATMADRLSAMARQQAKPPVRFVKTIGDAVMVVSPEASPLIASMLELIEDVAAEQDLPPLRVGIAIGPAINRGGDWYGTAVNIASRVTNHARPGSVLATKEVRDHAAEEYSWSRAGSQQFKNVTGRVSLHRARLRGSSGNSP